MIKSILLILSLTLLTVLSTTSPFENYNCAPCPNPPDIQTLMNKFPESVVKYYIQTTRFRHTLEKSFVPYCDKKYPDATSHPSVELLKKRNVKLMFSVIMHDDEKIFAHWYHQFMMFLSWFPNQNMFVSLREYNSRDRTPIWLNLMSRVLEARGIPHEFHLDNSLKILNKNTLLQNSISPLFSRQFDEIIFMEAYAFCAVDLAHFVAKSLDRPVALSPVITSSTKSNKDSDVSEEKCNELEKKVYSVDPELFQDGFTFENGFCAIAKKQKIFLISETPFFDTVQNMEKN